MLLLVSLNSVAIAVYLFEWISNKLRNKIPKTNYAYEFVDDIQNSDIKVKIKDTKL